MIFISILILIVAIALPSINKLISPILLARISSIVFIYAGVLSFNALYIQSIGSGIGIYSGLFHITTVSQLLDTFIFIIAAIVLYNRFFVFIVFYNQSIGSCIYSGLFHITSGSQFLHIFSLKPSILLNSTQLLSYKNIYN